jgi:hypothetical protein
MPMNAAIAMSKKCMDVQIKLEKVKSFKLIDVINADVVRNGAKCGSKKQIQKIEPLSKLHPLHLEDQSQTILHAIKDFPKDLNNLKVFLFQQPQGFLQEWKTHYEWRHVAPQSIGIIQRRTRSIVIPGSKFTSALKYNKLKVFYQTKYV